MKKYLFIVMLIGLLISASGCFSGPHNTPSDRECRYRCSKCGKKVLLLNSLLRSQKCPLGGTHDWQRNTD